MSADPVRLKQKSRGIDQMRVYIEQGPSKGRPLEEIQELLDHAKYRPTTKNYRVGRELRNFGQTTEHYIDSTLHYSHYSNYSHYSQLCRDQQDSNKIKQFFHQKQMSALLKDCQAGLQAALDNFTPLWRTQLPTQH
ncbi:hypothetical protein C8R45DRAFT_934446 [Mycena sanguinolenta]|nr:hypothetical protein C8R45DRAFT_944145 [Mycena sanguinolenta]KAJ6477798.1 hypothetical protein C8R45DRAFT_934446 [Mycena sanguinolenta]